MTAGAVSAALVVRHSLGPLLLLGGSGTIVAPFSGMLALHVTVYGMHLLQRMKWHTWYICKCHWFCSAEPRQQARQWTQSK